VSRFHVGPLKVTRQVPVPEEKQKKKDNTCVGRGGWKEVVLTFRDGRNKA